MATAWLGPHLADSAPVAVYGAVLLGASVAYRILVRCLIGSHGSDSRIARAVGNDAKGKLSVAAYAVAIAAAPFVPWISVFIYVALDVAWLVPDRRITRVLSLATGDSE